MRSGGRAPLVSTRHTLGQRIRGARQVKQDLAHPVRWAKDKLLAPLPEDEELDRPGLQRPGPGKPDPGMTDRLQQQAGETQRRTGQGQQLGGRSDEQPREAHPRGQSERADAAERLGRNGEQTAQVQEGTAAVESPVTVPRDRVSSATSGGAGSSRRNRVEAEKPPRLERVARMAAYASDPEADEAAWLANARRPPTQAQQSGQSLPSTHQHQPPPRAATESAGVPPNAHVI